jgi:hypothetical protein
MEYFIYQDVGENLMRIASDEELFGREDTRRHGPFETREDAEGVYLSHWIKNRKDPDSPWSKDQL